ncbi:hypothetical protein KXJ74_06080 [Acinetobacter johnsonii]|jgi:hypothetical protein|nr:hypothetical protein KXJ74_06080 [Acinetobacter johnsonii]
MTERLLAAFSQVSVPLNQHQKQIAAAGCRLVIAMTICKILMNGLKLPLNNVACC